MVADGKMSQADFDAWMRGQVFQGKQWAARKAEIDQVLLNADKAAVKIVNEGKISVFADNANYIGYGLEHDLRIDSGFTLYDESTVARLIQDDPQILPMPAPGVVKEKAFPYYNRLMSSAITQGIIQGETIPQIARRIMDKTGESSYKSAVRNARTAFTGAQNAGRIEGLHQAQSLGIDVKKKWMATLDFRTRDTHRDLDGQVRDVDEPFSVDGDEIDFPGDPKAKPALVYNCRCTLIYEYPQYPSSMERLDNITREKIGDMTYREWEAMKAGNDQESIQADNATIQPQTSIESLRAIAESSQDKYDFWMSLDEDQQAVFKASGMSLDDAFNLLHSGAEQSEWKAPSPGGIETFAIHHDYSNESVAFNPIRAKSNGWMADANAAGIINIREDGLGDDWEFIISHEAGHQLSDFCDELQQIIISNPGNILGRYNTRLMAFDGVYGEYNPDEAFATSVSNYVRHPRQMKEKYPETYAALDKFFTASPSALDFVKNTMSEYERRFKR